MIRDFRAVKRPAGINEVGGNQKDREFFPAVSQLE
jgi:hypothetical protein